MRNGLLVLLMVGCCVPEVRGQTGPLAPPAGSQELTQAYWDNRHERMDEVFGDKPHVIITWMRQVEVPRDSSSAWVQVKGAEGVNWLYHAQLDDSLYEDSLDEAIPGGTQKVTRCFTSGTEGHGSKITAIMVGVGFPPELEKYDWQEQPLDDGGCVTVDLEASKARINNPGLPQGTEYVDPSQRMNSVPAAGPKSAESDIG